MNLIHNPVDAEFIATVVPSGCFPYLLEDVEALEIASRISKYEPPAALIRGHLIHTLGVGAVNEILSAAVEVQSLVRHGLDPAFLATNTSECDRNCAVAARAISNVLYGELTIPPPRHVFPA